MFALYELIEVLPDSFQPTFPGRLNELFVFLRNQEKKLSEKAVAHRFLNGATKGKYFNKLKNELKREIIKYIIIHPSVWVDAAYKALHEDCYKSFATYKILLLAGKRKAAIEMAKVLLAKLRKVELHGLIYQVATDLRFHHSGMEVSANLTKKYDKIARAQMEILKAESIVRSYHSKIVLIQNTRESYTKTILEELKEASLQTLPFLQLGSNYLNRFIYNIAVCRYMAEFDYTNVIKYTDEAINSFAVDHPNSKALCFAFIQKKLPALVAIGEFSAAKKLAKEACQMMPPGNFNWHLALIRRVVICLYSKDYQEAYDLYKAHSQQSCPYPTLTEYWQILWAYLYFLIKVGHIKQYTEERFYLGKFINEVPIYSKDKAGNNINILIVQILIRLERAQYGQIIDRIDALKTYARTHTKNPETTRANIFINMIIKMEAAQFHRSGTERKTQKLRERLAETPLRVGQNLAIEILPFEVLWEEVLGMLEDKFHALNVNRSSEKTPRKKE